MVSMIRIVTTLEGFEVMKNFVSEELKKIPDYNDGNYMDSFHEKIESKEDNYVIFGWDWVKFRVTWPDGKAIVDALDFLEESNIPYRFRRMYEGYCGDIDQIDFDNDNVLPEIYTSVKFTYDIQVKNKYLVVVKDSFVRDMQVAPKKYIDDFYKDNFDNDYDWDCVGEGELVVGIYEGKNEEEVLENAAKSYHIDKRALKIYELR